MDRITLWENLWKDIIRNIDKGAPDFELYNPRILIDDILDEIEFNAFKNKDNRKLFYEKLTLYLKEDQIVKNCFLSQFQLLRREFNSDRLNLVKHVAINIRYLFTDGLYFKEGLTMLKKYVSLNSIVTTEEYNKIKYLSLSLIIEFIKKGYSVKDISGFPQNIMDGYEFFENEYLVTKFPHCIKINDFLVSEGNVDRHNYNDAISSKIDVLSTEDRFDALLYYYEKKTRLVYYLFNIEGLKGDDEITIGDVTFYNKNKKSFFNKENLLFGTIDGTDAHMHVAVEVNYLMAYSSLQEAVSKIEGTFDLISCYFETKTPLLLKSSSFSIVDKGGEFITDTHSVDNSDSFQKHYDALESDLIVKSEVKFRELARVTQQSSPHKESQSKIRNSLHWYRKGKDSIKNEDKILNYWIAIENLFYTDTDINNDILVGDRRSKIHLIQECISASFAITSIRNTAFDLFQHFAKKQHLESHLKLEEKTYPFDESLLQRSQLNIISGRIDLSNFISCLEEIKTQVKEEFIINRIETLQKLYTDSIFLKKYLENEINVIKNNVLMLYRYRNMIVHNAHYENMLLPYFSNTLMAYSGFFIRKIIREFNDSNGSLSDFFLKTHIQKELILSDLSNGKINLFDKN